MTRMPFWRSLIVCGGPFPVSEGVEEFMCVKQQLANGKEWLKSEAIQSIGAFAFALAFAIRALA
jgi:hypothetical protein